MGSGVGAADAGEHPAVEGVLAGLASSHGQGTTSNGPLGQPRLAVPAERETLRHLQQEGLVTVGNRGMVRVNHLTPVEVRGLFRGCARRQRGSRSQRSPPRPNGGQWWPGCGRRWHNWPTAAATPPPGAIMNGGPDNTPPMMSLDRHSPIVDAIEKGDVPAAVAVVEEHMAAAAEHFADARDAD